MATEGGAKLPGIGKVSKKWIIIVGAGSVVSIGYFLYRRSKNNAAAAASTAPAAADTTGQIDPLTGDIAGSEQDQMDLANLQSGGYGSGMYGAGAAGGYYAGTGALGTSGVTPPVPGTGGFTTNGQWAQQAEQDLGGIGISQTALAAALGHYLTGQQLAGGEQSLVDQAIAEENYPPVAGPGGYPPAMHTAPTGSGGGTGGGGTGGGGTGTTVKVPNVVGQTVNAAHSALTHAGLSYNADTAKDKPGYVRKVSASNPKAGSSVAKGSHVGLTWSYVKS